MKIALTCLAAALILPNVALAQHYACMRIFAGYTAEVLHVAIFDHNKNIIMDESKSFVGAYHYTIKNSRGRFDYNSKETPNQWSAYFDGQDWKGFHWQLDWGDSTSDYKIGCYDRDGSTDYCKEPSLSEMKEKCLAKIND